MRLLLSPLRSCALALCAHGGLLAGPYSTGLDDPANAFDAPVPGFVGPDGEGFTRLPIYDEEGEIIGYENERNYLNPLFFGWALNWSDYRRSDGQSGFNVPSLSLGPVTGDSFDVVSLGDLTAAQITGGTAPGRLRLHFTDASQPEPIRNLSGADFVVFENGFFLQSGSGIFGELAYVEVSTNGVDFARFPSVSLTPTAVGAFGTFNPTNVFGLAGKHANHDDTLDCWGTPFDLAALANHPLVLAGTLNLSNVRYVRVVDIPGNGGFADTATPAHAIYDPWRTTGSGGFDLEAIGVISRAMDFETWQDLRGLSSAARGANTDADGDGVPNLWEYAAARLPDAADESAPLTTCERVGGRAAIFFTRDERAADLRYEVQVSETLAANSWTTIAQSVAGAPVAGANGHMPAITESRASHIASVGVVRRVRVADVQANATRRFLRVKISLLP